MNKRGFATLAIENTILDFFFNAVSGVDVRFTQNDCALGWEIIFPGVEKTFSLFGWKLTVTDRECAFITLGTSRQYLEQEGPDYLKIEVPSSHCKDGWITRVVEVLERLSHSDIEVARYLEKMQFPGMVSVF